MDRSPSPSYGELRDSDPERIGDYYLIGRLGQGGQGVVYLCRTTSGRWVALKALRAALAEDVRARTRFEKEVAATRRIPPTQTAAVLDFDLAHDPPYIVSDYVAGPSLRQWVQREGPMTGAALTDLALRSAIALEAVHRAGVVHRDLKPSNVLLGRDGPRIIDFGIARALDATVTLTGAALGTPAYAAPEQLVERSFAVQPASDCWAWAATIAYAGLGRAPFGEDMSGLQHRVLEEPADLGDLPRPLRETLNACFALDPADRPSAEQLIDHLRHGTVPRTAKRTSRRPNRNRMVVAVSVTVVLVAGAIAFPLWLAGRTADPSIAGTHESPTGPPASTAPARPSATRTPSKAPSSAPAAPNVRRPRTGRLPGTKARLLEKLEDSVLLHGYGIHSETFFPNPVYHWDPDTGRFNKARSGLQAEVVSPDRRWTAVVPQFGKPYDTMLLIDRASGSRRPIGLPGAPVHTPLWSADGRRLLMTAMDDEGTTPIGYVIVDTEEPGAPLRVLNRTGHRFYWNHATGQVLAARDASADSNALVYRSDGRLLREMPGVGQLAGAGFGPVSPDGRMLLTHCPDGTGACVRSTSTGDLLYTRKFGGKPVVPLLGWYDNDHHLLSLKANDGWRIAIASADSKRTTQWLISGADNLVFVFYPVS